MLNGNHNQAIELKMDHQNKVISEWVGTIFGTTCGCVHFMQISYNLAFVEKLVQAGVTALFTGACGAIGSIVVLGIYRRHKKNKNQNPH